MRSQFTRTPILVIALIVFIAFFSFTSFSPLPLTQAQSGSGRSGRQATEHADPDEHSDQHRQAKEGEPDLVRQAKEALIRHEMNRQHYASLNEGAESTFLTNISSTDINDMAVLQDDGRLVIQPNPFDLSGRSVQFTPSGSSYTVSAPPASFDSNLGTKLDLTTAPAVNPKPQGEPGDDAYIFQDFGFDFTFYGVAYGNVAVTSNGCLVFRPAGMSDAVFNEAAGNSNATTQGAFLSDLLRPVPRIAPFWHDLDARASVTQGASGVYIRKAADHVVITWNSIRDFPNNPEDNGVHTFQTVLFSDGRILFNYSSGTLISDITTGISPGNSDSLSSVNFFSPPATAFASAIAELFTVSTRLDDVGTVAAFYSTHPNRDVYDFVYLFLDFDFDLGGGVLAFYRPIRNDVRGIGKSGGSSEVFDLDPNGAGLGTQKMQGYLNMVSLNSLPDYPTTRYVRADSVLSIMGQEQGHRWLSYVTYPGFDSTLLLGRDNAHWSFFMNTETTLSSPAARRASSMEGNVWRDNGGGSFTSTGLTDGYTRLDQYLMGLRPASEVPEMFVITNLTSSGGRSRGSNPQPGINVNGTKQTVTIDQIIQQNGARIPDANTSPKNFRAAVVLLTRAGTTPSQASLNKLARLRLAWESYFAQSTDYKGTINTGLADQTSSRVIAAASAASYAAVLTPGGIGVIFGTGLAAQTQAAPSQPLPTTLAGTQVLINGVPAPLYFVSPTQINFQIPASTAATYSATVQSNTATIEVISNGQLIRAGAVQVAPAVPAIFTADASGSGAAAALDGFTFTPAPFNAKQANGQPNIIAVFGTGLGADATDVDGNVSASVQATIDGSAVTVNYAGRAPGFTGLNQVNIVLPANITSGNHTVIISRNGIAGNPTTIAIK
ncbi:MAG TPA: IPT/TIG domain-containing protein [Blastocatellia bacterium]|nr:IPT/TIG domain-containing protein [Blastocatellia bacterium]